MPEAKIGLFCDAGAANFLSRIRKNIGMYLGLIGKRLGGKDMVRLGLAEYYIPSNKIEYLVQDINKLALKYSQDIPK